jgi:Spy/CpxP family protein refolding chaperone
MRIKKETLFIMKKLGITFLMCGIIGIATVFAIAQGRGGFGYGFLFDKIANELGLSAEQKAQAKQVLEDSKARIEPLMEALKAGHESAKDLGTNGTFDEKAVNALATQQSETMKQIIIEKEKTKAALFAILTPEQRTKAEQIRETFESKMRERVGKRGNHENGFPPMF